MFLIIFIFWKLCKLVVGGFFIDQYLWLKITIHWSLKRVWTNLFHAIYLVVLVFLVAVELVLVIIMLILIGLSKTWSTQFIVWGLVLLSCLACYMLFSQGISWLAIAKYKFSIAGTVCQYWLALVLEIWSCFWGERANNFFEMCFPSL